MPTVFEKEFQKASERPKITDQAGLWIFRSAIEQCTDESKAKELYEMADNRRLGTVREQHEAAYTYLALAFTMLENKKIGGEPISHNKLFHFAGHAFREIGQLNRAADAYWRAGVTSKNGEYPTRLGIRSIARAKICYEETGETAKSDKMHSLEWDARRHGSPIRHKPFLYLWALTSRYGTEPFRWIICTMITIAIFTIFYEFMHQCYWIDQKQPWTPWISALYYCVVTMTTLGYGEFVPNHAGAQSFVVINVLFGYFLLGVGVTILGRRVIGR